MAEKFEPVKPSHRGLLHEKLHVPQGQPIPEAKIEKAAHSPNITLEREAHFAEVAKHWHHPGHGK